MASTAAIFDKQELRSQNDVLNVGKLLDDALAEYMNANGAKLPQEIKDMLMKRTDEVARQIKQFICYSEDADGVLGTPAAGLKSPQLPPLSPPPVDAEVTALEAEVEAASNRVAQLRIAMQAQVQEQLAAKLTNCLPTADWSPPKPPTGDASHAAGPAPEELRSRLAEAAHKMPELRARLEDAHSRLERVLDVAAAEGDRPPPNTVERAVLGIEDGEEGGDAVAQGDATGEVPTAVKKALQSGRVSMRSRGEVKPLELEGDGGEERAGEAMDE